MVGMFYEHGPWKPPTLAPEGSANKYIFEKNDYSWNEVGHVLYVEQPLLTGFSIPASSKASSSSTGGGSGGTNTSSTDNIVTNEFQVGEDFYAFLLSFYKVFPQFASIKTPLILSGESYAGKYIPFIAQTIIKRQEASDLYHVEDKDVHIPLHGVLIGNGAIDPQQDLSHAAYGYYHGLIPLGAKLAIENHSSVCNGRTPGSDDRKDTLGVTKDAHNSVDILGNIYNCDTSMMVQVLLAAGQPNEYNTATFVGYDALMEPTGPFHTFFNDVDVQQALHVIDKETTTSSSSQARVWAVCSDIVATDMVHDHPISSVHALQFLSERTRVLLYSGENDLNCNFLGTQRVLESHKWRGGQSWKSAQRSLYHGIDPTGVGKIEVKGEYFTIDEKMSFLIIRNSGHLVPMDQPAVALDLIRRFAADVTFADVSMPNEYVYYTQLAKSFAAERAAAEKEKETEAETDMKKKKSGSMNGATKEDASDATSARTGTYSEETVSENLEEFKALFMADMTKAVLKAKEGGGGAAQYLAPVAVIGLVYWILNCRSNSAAAYTASMENSNNSPNRGPPTTSHGGHSYGSIQPFEGIEVGRSEN